VESMRGITTRKKLYEYRIIKRILRMIKINLKKILKKIHINDSANPETSEIIYPHIRRRTTGIVVKYIDKNR
jgi:hypothetical protein